MWSSFLANPLPLSVNLVHFFFLKHFENGMNIILLLKDGSSFIKKDFEDETQMQDIALELKRHY